MNIAPKNYEYAIRRSCQSLEDIAKDRRFKKLPQWISGEAAPTITQLYDLAQKSQTPFGYFFVTEPPPLPVDVGIHDFRVGKTPGYSIEIREINGIIARCTERQEWLSAHLRDNDGKKKTWIGSFEIDDDPTIAANELNKLIPRPEDHNENEGILKVLIETCESIGVMINSSTTVGTNLRQKLEPNWFSSFSLSDPFAPLIFINGSIPTSLKLYSIAKQLGHLLLDQTGIDSPNQFESKDPTEIWCNQVGGSYLVPTELLRQKVDRSTITNEVIDLLSQHFNVNKLVVIKRLFETSFLDQDEYLRFWKEATGVFETTINQIGLGNSEDDFLAVQSRRLGVNFSTAVLDKISNGEISVFEGEELLGLSGQTLVRFAERLGYDGISDRY